MKPATATPAPATSGARDSRREYERRMHRVLEAIDRQLEQPLVLATLAEVAHFSPFHFHRLFTAWMGETFGDYLRRRRVETGAMRMAAQPRLSVLQVALSVGFGSPEAFTRAFNARFGCSPTAWRRQHVRTTIPNSNPGQVDRNTGQAPARLPRDAGGSFHPEPEHPMNVKVIERQPATVAYLRYTGPYGPAVGRFWHAVYYPWAVQNDLLGSPRYGISHDDPSITDAERCRYDAGVEVPADFVVPGKAFKTTIPGGRYACMRFYGGGDAINAAWESLLRDWLPASGYQLDARPCFEYYPTDGRYDEKTGAFECDLCIPVAPL